MNYSNRLEDAIYQSRSNLCVGLDPKPDFYNLRSPSELEKFCEIIIESAATRAPAIKFQFAFFESFGLAGLEVLSSSIALARQAKLLTILDAKRSDVDHVLRTYVTNAIGSGNNWTWEADALTINPFFSLSAINHDLAPEANDRAIYVGLSSHGQINEEIPNGVYAAADTFSSTLFRYICHLYQGHLTHGATFGIVSSAIFEGELKIHLTEFPGPILVPGVGAQGGKVPGEEMMRGRKVKNVLFSVSRALIVPGNWTTSEWKNELIRKIYAYSNKTL